MSYVQEIIDCLPKDKTRFQYFRDRYSTLLLPWLVEDGALLSDVKKSPYAPLLNKQPAKQVVSQFGDGRFNAGAFDMAWAEPHESFLLTLDKWGSKDRSYDQTSRAGHNLVLQLNMSTEYLAQLRRCVPDILQHWLDGWGHPTLKERDDGFFRQTLAWARIDLDLETGEAVIEEIQSDWIRDVRSLKRHLERWKDDFTAHEYAAAIRFCDWAIKKLTALWDEAILASAIWFLREEIGIRTVWYHTYDTGCKLKKIDWSKPPKSVYSTLPKRFCFQQTQEHPEFLMKERGYRRQLKKIDNAQWFVHRLI